MTRLTESIFKVLQKHNDNNATNHFQLAEIIPLVEAEIRSVKNCPISGVLKRFTFDCWYNDDGTPLKRYINGFDEVDARMKFEDKHPEMSFDDPYV